MKFTNTTLHETLPWTYFNITSLFIFAQTKAAYVLFYMRQDSLEEYRDSLSQVITSRGTQNSEEEEEVATETSGRKLRSHTGARSKRLSNGLSDSEEEMETN